MSVSSCINLILKDFEQNDNIIYISKSNDDYEYNCTCGKNYCHHLDYVIHSITQDFNKKYNKKCYELKGFMPFEYITKNIYDDNYFLHNIKITYDNQYFDIQCSCNSKDCFYLHLTKIDLITTYLKKKEIQSNLEQDIIILDEIQDDLKKLIL